MATCKECVHVGVCRYYTNELAKANGIPLKLEEVERLLECDDCENFKDRSRFVELPADGIMYGIIDGRVTELLNLILQPGGSGMSVLSPDNINKTIFFTREEAEQALKEREDIE